jgi:addiction module HigA family antidote
MIMDKRGMRPVHPGEVLREEYLVPLRMSANALAIALRVPAPRINDVVRERRSISPDTALRLACYFRGDPNSWMNLQISYDLARAEQLSGEKILGEIIPLCQKADSTSHAR